METSIDRTARPAAAQLESALVTREPTHPGRGRLFLIAEADGNRTLAHVGN